MSYADYFVENICSMFLYLSATSVASKLCYMSGYIGTAEHSVTGITSKQRGDLFKRIGDEGSGCFDAVSRGRGDHFKRCERFADWVVATTPLR